MIFSSLFSHTQDIHIKYIFFFFTFLLTNHSRLESLQCSKNNIEYCYTIIQLFIFFLFYFSNKRISIVGVPRGTTVSFSMRTAVFSMGPHILEIVTSTTNNNQTFFFLNLFNYFYFFIPTKQQVKFLHHLGKHYLMPIFSSYLFLLAFYLLV